MHRHRIRSVNQMRSIGISWQVKRSSGLPHRKRRHGQGRRQAPLEALPNPALGETSRPVPRAYVVFGEFMKGAWLFEVSFSGTPGVQYFHDISLQL